jgi:predicted nucleic acid-binding protein
VILVDTNIFARMADSASVHHAVCVEAVRRLTAAGERLIICAQVLIEFRTVATRPKGVNGLGMTALGVQQALDAILGSYDCLAEPPDLGLRWHQLATRYAVDGKTCHDARLAALMLAHGVDRILTLNGSHFSRFAEIAVVAPTDVVSTKP